jgi:DNA-binding GntR family transcriptional regulator
MTKARKSASGPSGTLSLGDQAYQKILAGLFDGTVPEAAFLSQRDLVEMLDVPVQPLRDALKVLEAEGIVKVHPRSGIQFVKADVEFAHNTYQYRTIIERAAARRFAEAGDMKQIKALIKEHQEMRKEIESSSFNSRILSKVRQLDRAFHGTIVASLNNPFVQLTADRLQNYVKLIQLGRTSTRPYLLRSMDEHLAILNACAARDADAAEKALTTHSQAALIRILGGL